MVTLRPLGQGGKEGWLLSHGAIMFKENDIITVEGRSMRGRNRIREHGNRWRVNRSDGEMLLIEPKDATDLRQLRWIHMFQDPHFKVISE